MLEISSLVVVNDVFLLELHNGFADPCDIVVENFALEDGEELGEIVHDLLPVALADGIAYTFGMRLVDKNLAFVKAHVEPPDDRVCPETKLKLLGLVNFIANIILALLDEQYFIDLVKLQVYHLARSKLTRLKRLQDIYHKILKLYIIPGVKAVVYLYVLEALIRVFFRKIEKLGEVLDEGSEQKRTINLSLDRGRKLV